MPFLRPTDGNRNFVRDLLLVSIWLLLLALVNQKSNFPIYSIFPYLFPVVLLTWRYGMVWGFVFSALAALAAVPGDYMTEHPKHDLYWAGFTTYLKLTCAAAGILIGKRITEKRSKT